jgi:hypothetical protein
MTIKYANGTVCKAIMLSHDEDEIRAVTAGSDNAQILRRVKGTWFKEIEPVAIEFEWHRTGRQITSAVDPRYILPELSGWVPVSLISFGLGLGGI